MANSMDVILVTFGASKTKEQLVTVPEFIYPESYPNNPPLNLTETEKSFRMPLECI